MHSQSSPVVDAPATRPSAPRSADASLRQKVVLVIAAAAAGAILSIVGFGATQLLSLRDRMTTAEQVEAELRRDVDAIGARLSTILAAVHGLEVGIAQLPTRDEVPPPEVELQLADHARRIEKLEDGK